MPHSTESLADRYPLLFAINNPAQLRKRIRAELPEIIRQLREFLIESVAGSGGHFASRQLWCWGENDVSQPGSVSDADINTPGRVGRDRDWMQVSAGADHSNGNDHTCTIKTSGQLWCWGRDTNGQLGLGSNTNYEYPHSRVWHSLAAVQCI